MIWIILIVVCCILFLIFYKNRGEKVSIPVAYTDGTHMNEIARDISKHMGDYIYNEQKKEWRFASNRGLKTIAREDSGRAFYSEIHDFNETLCKICVTCGLDIQIVKDSDKDLEVISPQSVAYTAKGLLLQSDYENGIDERYTEHIDGVAREHLSKPEAKFEFLKHVNSFKNIEGITVNNEYFLSDPSISIFENSKLLGTFLYQYQNLIDKFFYSIWYYDNLSQYVNERHQEELNNIFNGFNSKIPYNIREIHGIGCRLRIVPYLQSGNYKCKGKIISFYNYKENLSNNKKENEVFSDEELKKLGYNI